MGAEFADPLANAIREDLRRRPTDAYGATSAADPFGLLQLMNAADGSAIVEGNVVGAHPHLHWYRVKLDGLDGVVACRMATFGSSLPMGVHQSTMAPPGSRVLVYLPKTATKGVILCVLASPQTNLGWKLSDWTMQGSGVGMLRQSFYRMGLENVEGWGLVDWSGQRSVDGLLLDWALTACTGVGMLVSPFEAYLRVSEAVGLFLNYLDGYGRLAALQLDIQAPAWLIETRLDEGEIYGMEGSPVFLHEARGAYGRSDLLVETNSDEKTQREAAVGTTDLPEDDADIESFCRKTRFWGYLGQGGQEFLAAPPRSSGPRKRADAAQEFDHGLYHEFTTLAGAHVLRSAKSLTLLKRSLIPIPRRLRRPEDPQGDVASGEEPNYDPSEHLATEAAAPSGDLASVSSIVDLLDLTARLCNWDALHPFHYHEKDFKLPDESELPGGVSQQTVDFSELTQSPFLTPPQPRSIRVSEAIGDARYYAIESLLHLADDGTSVWRNGYGVADVHGPGTRSISAPGDIEITAGNRIILNARDVIIKGADNVDVSAATGDVRLKAERHLHALGGNNGSGGVMIESKGSGSSFDYDGKFGSDVTSPGLLLVAKQGTIGTLAEDIYLRSGASGGSGNIVLDAGRGQGVLTARAQTIDLFAMQELDIWHLRNADSGNIEKCHRFRSTSARLEGVCYINGDMFIDRQLLVGGSGFYSGSVVAKGALAQNGGGFVADSSETDFEEQVDGAREQIAQDAETGTDRYTAYYTGDIESSGRPGNSRVQETVGFSFRDDPQRQQYRAQGWKTVEPWYQQMDRLGLASGLRSRQENPVSYQGRDTYPFPGNEGYLQESTLVYSGEPQLYDAAEGRCKDRGEDYENYERSAPQTGPMQGSPKIV